MTNCEGRITIFKSHGSSESFTVRITEKKDWYQYLMDQLLKEAISATMICTLWPILYGYEGAKLTMETEKFKIELKPIQENK